MEVVSGVMRIYKKYAQQTDPIQLIKDRLTTGKINWCIFLTGQQKKKKKKQIMTGDY